MKRIFSLLISFALILSCSKDSVDPTPTPEPIIRYTIQFQAGTGGSVSTSGGSFDKGATISVTATPDGEYLFDSWSDGSTENPREITVTSNLNLTANFVKKKYNLTVNIDGEGTVEEEVIVQGSTSNTEYNSGTTVKLTAIASDEWVFTGWSGDVESTDNPIEVTVSEAKEITATFKLKQYDLSITVEGEGSVTETVISQPALYDSGTKLRLKATTTGEWSYFAGWTGDFESEENEIIIDINQPMSITAHFPDTNIIVNKNVTEISTSVTSWDVTRSFYDVSGVFPYKAGNDYYTFFAGKAEWTAGQSDNLTKDDIPSMPSQILKRVDGKWEFFKTDYDAYFWGARNYKIINNNVVIGDGNEIGPDGPTWNGEASTNRNWNGDAYFGNIQDDGNILWKKVNDEANRIWFHGISMGDLNGDNRMDIGGAPNAGYQNLKLFVQNEQGEFNVKNNLLTLIDGKQPFALDFHDLDGDSIDEIITASYGGGNLSTNPDLNNLRVYKYNSDTEAFEINFNSNNPTAFYNIGMGATSIQATDLNNDGIIDIVVAREDEAGNAFEVWRGNSSGGFDPFFSSPIWSQDELQFREFWILDVNQDSYMDIVLRPFHYGSLYRNNPVWWNVRDNNGIMLNYIIQINDGNGNFSSYETEVLKIEGLNVDNINPYMDEGILHFIGTFTPDGSVPYLETVDLKVRIQ